MFSFWHFFMIFSLLVDFYWKLISDLNSGDWTGHFDTHIFKFWDNFFFTSEGGLKFFRVLGGSWKITFKTSNFAGCLSYIQWMGKNSGTNQIQQKCHFDPPYQPSSHDLIHTFVCLFVYCGANSSCQCTCFSEMYRIMYAISYLLMLCLWSLAQLIGWYEHQSPSRPKRRSDFPHR